MDRSSLVRVLGIALLVLVAYKYLGPSLGVGGKSEARQPIPAETYVNAPGFLPDDMDAVANGEAAPPPPSEGTLCNIKGDRYDAVLSTRGAALIHLRLRDPQYAGTEGLDLVSTNGSPPRPIERWRSLRTTFRGPKGDDQVKYDRFDWTLEPSDGTSCKFSYADDEVRIEKVIAADDRPFELTVSTTLTNVGAAPHKHQLSIEEFAYRTNKEIKGGLGRVSPFATELSCAFKTDVKRKPKDDFKEGWFSVPFDDRYAAISNAYFAQALIPVDAPEAAHPSCDLLAEEWFTGKAERELGHDHARDADDAGAVYHARLEYPAEELQPQQSATYKQVAFFGPKERDVLAKAAGGGLA